MLSDEGWKVAKEFVINDGNLREEERKATEQRKKENWIKLNGDLRLEQRCENFGRCSDIKSIKVNDKQPRYCKFHDHEKKKKDFEESAIYICNFWWIFKWKNLKNETFWVTKALKWTKISATEKAHKYFHDQDFCFLIFKKFSQPSRNKQNFFFHIIKWKVIKHFRSLWIYVTISGQFTVQTVQTFKK